MTTYTITEPIPVDPKILQLTPIKIIINMEINLYKIFIITLFVIVEKYWK